jgi:hypothetical protein
MTRTFSGKFIAPTETTSSKENQTMTEDEIRIFRHRKDDEAN